MAESTLTLTNGHHPEPSPLKVIIVGAGIGGLTAAIALRQQGHEVHIFEQSRFGTELGAAIHLAPNANGVLKRLGIDAESFGANECEQVSEYTSEGIKMREMKFGQMNKIWQHKWLLAHRVSLHEALKKATTDPTSAGPAAILHLGSGVAGVDCEAGTITLKDGTKVSGDAIIGADGVHSVTRTHVPGGSIKPFGSGKSAFRFLISRESAREDPRTKKFAETTGELVMTFAPDRRLVMYPTSDNTLLNFVCIHPESESGGSGDWNTESSVSKLLDVYAKFNKDFRALLEKADPKTLKVWKLLDMEVLPTWIKHRLVLIGDAAHPFLPHQGQGGATAIEDAVALGIVLERGLRRDEVPVRLELYQKIRYERANRIQQYTRIAGRDVKDNSISLNLMEYTHYNFGHDEFDNATQRLREWKWAQTPDIYWRMPVAFGPMPGPRQTHFGIAQDGTASTFTTASIKIKTSRTVLQNLFPPGKCSWRFKSPGTLAYCSFSQTTLGNMQWLGGTGYNHLGLYIHGVEYVKDNGEAVSGTYLPLLFENLTDPIVSGREELGMPKLYSSIDIERDISSYNVRAGWQGMTWGNFQLNGLTPVESSAPGGSRIKVSMTGDDSDAGILVHRYVPQVGRDRKGQVEAEYAVFDPFEEAKPQPTVQRAWEAKSPKFEINARDWNALPTLHHVIQRLQEIPVYEIVAARLVEGSGVSDVAAARRLE